MHNSTLNLETVSISYIATALLTLIVIILLSLLYLFIYCLQQGKKSHTNKVLLQNTTSTQLNGRKHWKSPKRKLHNKSDKFFSKKTNLCTEKHLLHTHDTQQIDNVSYHNEEINRSIILSNESIENSITSVTVNDYSTRNSNASDSQNISTILSDDDSSTFNSVSDSAYFDESVSTNTSRSRSNTSSNPFSISISESSDDESSTFNSISDSAYSDESGNTSTSRSRSNTSFNPSSRSMSESSTFVNGGAYSDESGNTSTSNHGGNTYTDVENDIPYTEDRSRTNTESESSSINNSSVTHSLPTPNITTRYVPTDRSTHSDSGPILHSVSITTSRDNSLDTDAPYSQHSSRDTSLSDHDIRNITPENTAPQNTAPQNTAPQNTAPQNTAPQNTAPQNTAPQNTAPENTASENTASENTAPQSTQNTKNITQYSSSISEERSTREKTQSTDHDHIPERNTALSSEIESTSSSHTSFSHEDRSSSISSSSSENTVKDIAQIQYMLPTARKEISPKKTFCKVYFSSPCRSQPIPYHMLVRKVKHGELGTRQNPCVLTHDTVTILQNLYDAYLTFDLNIDVINICKETLLHAQYLTMQNKGKKGSADPEEYPVCSTQIACCTKRSSGRLSVELCDVYFSYAGQISHCKMLVRKMLPKAKGTKDNPHEIPLFIENTIKNLLAQSPKMDKEIANLYVEALIYILHAASQSRDGPSIRFMVQTSSSTDEVESAQTEVMSTQTATKSTSTTTPTPPSTNIIHKKQKHSHIDTHSTDTSNSSESESIDTNYLDRPQNIKVKPRKRKFKRSSSSLPKQKDPALFQTMQQKTENRADEIMKDLQKASKTRSHNDESLKLRMNKLSEEIKRLCTDTWKEVVSHGTTSKYGQKRRHSDGDISKKENLLMELHKQRKKYTHTKHTTPHVKHERIKPGQDFLDFNEKVTQSLEKTDRDFRKMHMEQINTWYATKTKEIEKTASTIKMDKDHTSETEKSNTSETDSSENIFLKERREMINAMYQTSKKSKNPTAHKLLEYFYLSLQNDLKKIKKLLDEKYKRKIHEPSQTSDVHTDFYYLCHYLTTMPTCTDISSRNMIMLALNRVKVQFIIDTLRMLEQYEPVKCTELCEIELYKDTICQFVQFVKTNPTSHKIYKKSTKTILNILSVPKEYEDKTTTEQESVTESHLSTSTPKTASDINPKHTIRPKTKSVECDGKSCPICHGRSGISHMQSQGASLHTVPSPTCPPTCHESASPKCDPKSKKSKKPIVNQVVAWGRKEYAFEDGTKLKIFGHTSKKDFTWTKFPAHMLLSVSKNKLIIRLLSCKSYTKAPIKVFKTFLLFIIPVPETTVQKINSLLNRPLTNRFLQVNVKNVKFPTLKQSQKSCMTLLLKEIFPQTLEQNIVIDVTEDANFTSVIINERQGHSTVPIASFTLTHPCLQKVTASYSFPTVNRDRFAGPTNFTDEACVIFHAKKIEIDPTSQLTSPKSESKNGSVHSMKSLDSV